MNAPSVKGKAKTCQIKTEVSNRQELTDQKFDAGKAYLRSLKRESHINSLEEIR